MLLHNIMFWWGCLALLLVITAIVGLFTHKGAGTNEPRKALLDFSGGQAEGHQMQKVLTEALSGTKTDAEFEQHFKALKPTLAGMDAETSWAWLNRLLMEYRKANEFEPAPRQLAERFLADIPRRYNLKDIAPEPTQPAA